MAQTRPLGQCWQRFLVVSVFALPFEVVTISLIAGAPPAGRDAAITGVTSLLELEQKVKKVVDAVMPATVALRMTPGTTQGSGVIVNPDGLIPTAGHVIGRPGRTCRITTLRVDGTFGQAEIDDGGAGLVAQVRCLRSNRLTRDTQALVFDYDEAEGVYHVAPLDKGLEEAATWLKE